MGIAEIFSLIVGLIRAVPVIKKAFEELVFFYVKVAQAKHDDAFKKAMDTLIRTNDASELEEAAGLPNAGKETPDRRDVRRRRDQ